MVIVGATGAVTALGDTLFPAASLRTAIAQDFSAGSYYLLRLRILHPVMALVTITSLWWVVASLRRSPSRTLQRLAATVLTLILLQVTLGALNVVLLAPAWLQIVHLFVADVLWVAIVLLAAESLTRTTAQYERQSGTPAATCWVKPLSVRHTRRRSGIPRRCSFRCGLLRAAFCGAPFASIVFQPRIGIPHSCDYFARCSISMATFKPLAQRVGEVLAVANSQ
jgi:cell division protein FtsW (lipid II flippase)